MDFYGSLCLSDIPRRLIKVADNGKKYLNISVVERKEVGKYGETHFITASCKKEEQIEGEKRFIGGIQPYAKKSPTPQDVEQMPPLAADDDLPF